MIKFQLFTGEVPRSASLKSEMISQGYLYSNQNRDTYIDKSRVTISHKAEDVFLFEGDGIYPKSKTNKVVIRPSHLGLTDEMFSSIIFGSNGESDLNIQGFVFVDNIDKLPPAVGGVHLLEPFVCYYITVDLDLDGNRIVCQENTCILGTSSENSFITSTGLVAGVPLISSNFTLPIRHITVRDVDTAFFVSGDGITTIALDWTGVNFVNVAKMGVFNQVTNFVITKCAGLNAAEMEFDTSIDSFVVTDSFFGSFTYGAPIFNFRAGLNVNRRIRYTNSVIQPQNAASIGINIDTGGAGVLIQPEAYILDKINFSGLGEFISGYTAGDDEARFSDCRGIENTSNVSSYFMEGNTIPTNIPIQGVPVKIAGVTTSSVSDKFSNSNNRATCTTEILRRYKVTCNVSLQSGFNDSVSIFVAVGGNGVPAAPIFNSRSERPSGSIGFSDQITLQWVLEDELGGGDFVEIWITNDTGAGQVLVTSLNTIIEII